MVWFHSYYRDALESLVKAADAAEHGATVCVLLPITAIQRPWDKAVAAASETIHIEGQPKFIRPDGTRFTLPFRLVLVVFRPSTDSHSATTSPFQPEPAPPPQQPPAATEVRCGRQNSIGALIVLNKLSLACSNVAIRFE